jgi:hypothetical protein
MRTRMHRLILFLASLSVITSGATAGIALGSRSGPSPIDQAAAKSATAPSVKFDFTLAIAGGGTSIPGGKITLGGTGAVDSKHKAADFTLDLGSLAPLLGAATKGAQVPKSIELVVVNNVVYINFPALAKQLGAAGKGKQWVKFDPSALPKSKTGGINPKAVSSVTPQQALAALRSALSVHQVGSDHYGTHYHAIVNLSAIVALVPKSQQASTRASLAKAGLKTIPVDVWVGKLGYLRRFVASLAVKAQKGSPAVKLAVTVNLHDYGAAVHVSAPPASKTVDGTKLLSSLASGVTGG